MATNTVVQDRSQFEAESTSPLLPLSTLPCYLIGSRSAIRQLAETKSALWIGLLFVLSAGFAREYDGVDLRREPWHLALPLVASLATSLVLYGVVRFAAFMRIADQPSFIEGYRTLLTFYWWTAPLAWLYAIPVERFMSPGDATAANLWLLAIVSAWRVLLITRALSVWLSAGFVSMFVLVMLFADSVALLLAYLSPWPIFNVMGGVRLSAPDAVVLNALLTVTIFGGISWFIWFAAAIAVISKRQPTWGPVDRASSERRVSIPLWLAAGVSLLLGAALLPLGQPEQQRGHYVQQQLKSGNLDEAVQYVSRFEQDDFPPVWDPPPRLGYNEESPPIGAVLDAIERHNAPRWFTEIYVEKLSQDPSDILWDAAPHGAEADAAALKRALDLLEKYKPAASLDLDQRWNLEYFAKVAAIDNESRRRLNAYLGMNDEGQSTEAEGPRNSEVK